MVHNFTCRTVCNIFGVLICSFGGCIISSTFILLPPSELSLSFFCIFAFCLNNFLKKICDRLINWHSYIYLKGLSWSWSYGSWIYNYLCYQCLSPLTLWVWISLRRVVLDTALCDKVCQWLTTGRWFSPVSSTNNTDFHDIARILLKVALNIITLTLYISL